MKYRITAKSKGKEFVKEINNRTLKHALHNWLSECIETSNNEVFLNADTLSDEEKANKNLHIVNGYGIFLKSVECIDSTKPKTANEFRAKRELLGYTLPELANILGVSDMTLKRIESGKSDLYDFTLKLWSLFA